MISHPHCAPSSSKTQVEPGAGYSDATV